SQRGSFSSPPLSLGSRCNVVVPPLKADRRMAEPQQRGATGAPSPSSRVTRAPTPLWRRPGFIIGAAAVAVVAAMLWGRRPEVVESIPVARRDVVRTLV